MCRSALYSPFAPAFRSRECHKIRPCTAQSLSLTEARLRNYRTSLFIQPLTRRDSAAPSAWDVVVDIV
jgi:hypothetical protein